MSVVQFWPPPVLVGGVGAGGVPPSLPPHAASNAVAATTKAKGRERLIVGVDMVSAPGVGMRRGCSACTWMPETFAAVHARTAGFNSRSERDAGAEDPGGAAAARVRVAAGMAG